LLFSGLENESTNEKAENRTSWLLHEGVGDDQMKQQQACNSDSSSSSLPAWLQQYKNENKGISYNDQVSLLSQSYLHSIPIIFYHAPQIKIYIKYLYQFSTKI